MMRAVVACVVVLAACGDPPPITLKFRITDGDVQACTNDSGDQVVSCKDIPMLCDALVSIRIFAPNDPTAPFISACAPLQGGTGNTNTVCQIASVTLTPPDSPTRLQDLEVDMAVFDQDPSLMNLDGTYRCPPVTFGADGFLAPPQPCTDPQHCDPAPAIGGRAFYHPGDTETVVTLGCSDLSELRQCVGDNIIHVSAGVTDFDTTVSVSPATADGLIVSVGEPVFDSAVNGYVLRSPNAFPLPLVPMTPVPVWGDDVAFTPLTSACIDVREDAAQTTSAVACTSSISAGSLDLHGTRLAKAALDSLLPLLPNPNSFPVQGLVVGKALTYLGGPAAGVTIIPSNPAATIHYLADDGTLSGAVTGMSGIWISLDAPYGTVFHALGMTAAPDVYGGLIAGKVNIVITQFKPPGNG